jgi:hypothetical protein
MARRGSANGRGTVFPIVAFGFPHDSDSPAAASTWAEKSCPFAEGLCEKQRQYGFGYCSISYAAEWDNGNQQTYAVCDHRLDGLPVKWALADYFGDREPIVVPEVTATVKPKLNIDYVAFSNDPSALDGMNVIAIETQAIDIRGGSVVPAWRAWEDGKTAEWRSYYTAEARRSNRPDEVNYGVNTGNVYKRLGTQVAEKSVILKEIKVPLYVVMQYSIFRQLRSRINFVPSQDGDPWEITFGGFEYDGTFDSDGKLRLRQMDVVRTTVDEYLRAMFYSRKGKVSREDFIARIQNKARVSAPRSKARNKAKVDPAHPKLF